MLTVAFMLGMKAYSQDTIPVRMVWCYWFQLERRTLRDSTLWMDGYVVEIKGEKIFLDDKKLPLSRITEMQSDDTRYVWVYILKDGSNQIYYRRP
jgi:hypothetical protein